MKIAILFLWICLFAIQVFADKNNGQIKQQRPGFYLISYPGQTINVYFNSLPTNGLEHFFVETDLPEIEKYEIVNILKEQIDLLPTSIIEDYLDIDLYLLNIQNRHEFGYTFDKQMVVEISKIKDGMSYVNSIQSSLVHEIGHLIVVSPECYSAVQDLENYLTTMHQTYSSFDENDGNNVFQSGYVSMYASGELTNHYDASDEFSEIFAHLVCTGSRSELLNYVENHPETILSIKVDRFLSFLDGNIPALGTDYIFDDIEHPERTRAPFNPLSGEQLLAAHELRSYKSINFNVMGDREEPFLAWQEEDIDSGSEPFNDWEKLEQDMENTVYEYDNPSESYIQRESTPYSPNKKKKKTKKRNGTGLLITGAALYVLLQLLK